MLTTALKYKKAIREITGEDALLDYVLVASEWVALENLCEAFKDATTYFSRADANLATVIPAIDKLDAMLATAVIKKRGDTPDVILGKPMQAALLVAKDTLNKYYNLSDDSELYRIALMLHPKYKTSYFDDHHWPVDWKDSATGLIRRVFNEYLSAYEAATGDSPKTSTTTTSAPAQQV
ncbi:hypothetical protein BDZ89DRAFT_964158 [Hymenopellis radicata]|nr:hypothetical protein BDZ89DRAFT_964158 [Hymenopellis radicata]